MRASTIAWLLPALIATSAQALDEACFSTVELTGDTPEDELVLREVWVDTAPFTGEPGGELLWYDPEQVLDDVTVEELQALPEWALGVRLVLSEVGPDRLLDSRWGLVEAVGILQTVFNRLDPDVWNPEAIEGVLPWPGCGPTGTFTSCANPRQYAGLRTARALAPRTTVRDTARLRRAADIATAAWWLQVSGQVPDVTNGATSFVHRCGGSAYGASTIYCDRRGPTPDRAGADPTRGPLVLQGPTVFLRSRGRYQIEDRRLIDYTPTTGPLSPGAAARYLFGRDAVPVDRGQG